MWFSSAWPGGPLSFLMTVVEYAGHAGAVLVLTMRRPLLLEFLTQSCMVDG